METFTLNFGGFWIARVCGRNPLVRSSDRLEALLQATLLISALLLASFAGALGTAVHDSRSHVYADELSNRHTLTAIVDADPTTTIKRSRLVVTAPVRWRVDGVDHVETAVVDETTKAGDRWNVWVDAAGKRAPAPTPAWRAGMDGLLAGAGVWLGLMAVVIGLHVLVWSGLNRRRSRSWDRELQALLYDADGRTGRHG
jgi:hypothetical protein